MGHIHELQNGLEMAFVDQSINSNLAYRPEFISNDCKKGKRVISSIEQELMNCEEFFISVAFITLGGITPLLQTLKVWSIETLLKNTELDMNWLKSRKGWQKNPCLSLLSNINYSPILCRLR